MQEDNREMSDGERGEGLNGSSIDVPSEGFPEVPGSNPSVPESSGAVAGPVGLRRRRFASSSRKTR